MTQEIKIFIEVSNGCVDLIYGDAPPEGYAFNFIVRDMDTLSLEDTDPLPNNFKPEKQYWN